MVVRPRLLGRIITAVFAVVFDSAAVGLMVSLATSKSFSQHPLDHLLGLTAIAGLAAAVSYGFYRIDRRRVVLENTALVVINPLRTYCLPLHEIRDIAVGSTVARLGARLGAVHVERLDGSRVSISVFGGAGVSGRLSRRMQRDFEQLRAEVLRRTRGPSEP